MKRILICTRNGKSWRACQGVSACLAGLAIGAVGSYGTSDGRFQFVYGAVMTRDRLFVGDWYGCRIQVFDM